jgi:hypothetical protein
VELNRGESLAELREGIEHDLHALAQPLKDRLAKVDELMQARLEDLTTLRGVRRQIVTALKPFIGEDEIPLAPGVVTKPGPKPHRGPHSRVSDERVEETLAWLRENVNGDEFVAKQIEQGLGFSNSATGAVVAILRQREQIRMTKENRGPHNPRRYRVVA